MKKVMIFLSLVLFVGVLAAPAYASFGFFKPSSKLYFLQPALESVRLFFTFSKEAKVDYLVELTERRTDEMNVTPSSEIADRYIKHFEQLNKAAEQTSGEKKEQIAEKIKEVSLRQQEVLAKVYNQVPEQAKEAVLNAQENSAKHVEKMLESVEGTEKAEEYGDEAIRIQQIGKSGQIKKLERIQQAPMEGSLNAEPSENIPKGLKEGKEFLPGKELNPLNPMLDEQGSGSGDEERMEPAAPVEMQQPVPLQ